MSQAASLREALTDLMIADLDQAARNDETAREIIAGVALVDDAEATGHPPETAVAPAADLPNSGSFAAGDAATGSSHAVPDDALASAAQGQTAVPSTDGEILEEAPTAESPSVAPPAPEPLPVVAKAPAAVPAAAPPASTDPLAPLAALSEDETIALFT
jgi:hypothetical protein